MKKTTITEEQMRADFEVITRYENALPARLMYDLSCLLLTTARCNEDPVTGRSYQWFVANMVECCYGVKKPADGNPRLITEKGLERLYTQDLNPRDFTVYCIAVLTTVNTAMQNLETADERRFARGLWTAQASMIHGVAEWINDVKPTQSSDR